LHLSSCILARSSLCRTSRAEDSVQELAASGARCAVFGKDYAYRLLAGFAVGPEAVGSVSDRLGNGRTGRVWDMVDEPYQEVTGISSETEKHWIFPVVQATLNGPVIQDGVTYHVSDSPHRDNPGKISYHI
jgi:hypothetical protein